MKKTIIKLILVLAAVLSADFWLIYRGMTAMPADFFISVPFEETLVFILLQLAVIIIYFVKPFTTKKTKLIYWCVTEVLVLATIVFWGFIIVGPIWFR